MSQHSKFIIRSRAIILNEGKLLVVKHTPGSDYYALPGGHLEQGETPVVCCEREIVEELGVSPTLGRLLYVHAFKDKGVTDVVEFFFEVKNGKDFVNFEGRERTHAFELAEVKWISPQDKINLLPTSLARDFKEGKLLSDETRYTLG